MTLPAHLKNLFLAAGLLITVGTARANQILEMANEADTIVLGEGRAPAGADDAAVVFTVQADLVLKGDAVAGSSFQAVYPQRAQVFQGQIYMEKLAPLSGSYGLWFFEGDNASYVRLPKSWPVPRGVSVEQLLLLAVVESYRAVASDAEFIHTVERSAAKIRLLNSLQYAGRFGGEAAALQIVEELMNSRSDEELEIALAAGIGLSHEPALVRFVAELKSTRLAADGTARIFATLANSYKPKQGSALIEHLIRDNQQAPVAGLDRALAGTIFQVQRKDTLPLAFLLLDSSDSQAVQQAVRYFHLYTVLALQDGSITTDGSGGNYPFSNERTRAHNGNDVNRLAVDADFWREWWAAFPAGQ